MTPECWARVQVLFEEAAALPPAARADHIRGVTDDPAVVSLVLSMLDGDATDDDALERAVGHAMREVAAGTTAPLPPRLGPYRVIAEI